MFLFVFCIVFLGIVALIAMILLLIKLLRFIIDVCSRNKKEKSGTAKKVNAIVLNKPSASDELRVPDSLPLISSIIEMHLCNSLLGLNLFFDCYDETFHDERMLVSSFLQRQNRSTEESFWLLSILECYVPQAIVYIRCCIKAESFIQKNIRQKARTEEGSLFLTLCLSLQYVSNHKELIKTLCLNSVAE
jgi:Na+-transporting methylmalonyl-CoA/oxaloacetate decarboxylase gamma subunit